jgi:membrane protein
VYSHAAAVAFYVLFSIPPLALALVSLVGLIPVERLVGTTSAELLDLLVKGLALALPEDLARALTAAIAIRAGDVIHTIEEFAQVDLRVRFQELLSRLLPPQPAQALGSLAGEVLGNPRPELLTLSFLGALWGAGAAVRAASRAMDVIYEVRRRGLVRRTLAWFLTSTALIGGFTLALVVLPILHGLIMALIPLLGLPAWMVVAWNGMRWVALLCFLLGSVLVLHRFGPNAVQRLGTVLPGSLATVGLWILLEVGLNVWMRYGWERYDATYGTLTGVIVLLLWSWLSALALLLGAELNVLVVRHRGQWSEVIGPRALVRWLAPSPPRRGP